MEQQGAAARYANCGDEENSQAEGSTEGAVGYSRAVESNNNPTNNSAANPHYENIYESIDQYAAAAAAPAVPENGVGVANVQPPAAVQPAAIIPNNNIAAAAAVPIASIANGAPSAFSSARSARIPAYRSELYDRTAGYDVPRQMFRNPYPTNGGASSGNTSKRRANLHLDLNPNRPRYTTASRPHRQRSFDDTESNYYNNFRYENIYEQIHEEPIYRNFSSSAGSNASGNRVYGRLGVIGHGIGRIERHLSSSCGNIDHYNLGGHYAVLGHSHLGTVGHIRLNTGTAPAGSTAKDTNGVKSLNFFSCLGRENSQSMNNIHRAATNGSGAGSSNAASTAPPTASSVLRPGTGAIPKTPKMKTSAQKAAEEQAAADESTSTTHDSSLNRISKSSLQWLLVNKWLPMWIGQEPDYNILDFNFMFSRNCGGCGDTLNRQQSVVRFNGHAEMRSRNEPARRPFGGATAAPSGGGSLRPMRLNHSLTRLRECEHGSLMRRDGSLDERNRSLRDNPYDRGYRGDDYYDRRARGDCSRDNDPFRNWELNTENNSFRPAGGVTRDIRRITDGTYPPAGASGSTGTTGNMVRQNSTRSTSGQMAKAGGSTKNIERLPNPRLAMDSRTESGNESPSPDLGGRRYSDNTEDDQHNDDVDVSDMDDD